MFVSCVHWKVMEGSGVGSAGCLMLVDMYVDVHGECLYVCVTATSLLLSMAHMLCHVCRSCGVHERCGICMACWSVIYVVNFCCC